MHEGPAIASIAALLGDPARANMLTALMDGRALTVSELAQAAGVGLPTTSGHLAKLSDAGLLTAEKQGRHRYFRLSDPDVAGVLEALMGLAQRTGAVRIRTGPRDAALRQARICYDHLAGERGVVLLNQLAANSLVAGDDAPMVTATGRKFFASIDLDIAALERGRRPVCRLCLDWSERRNHLSGALGAAILRHVFDRHWARRDGRALVFTPQGSAAFDRTFALDTASIAT
jgi:DNA-binding transcriptional ArsR family regulator